MYLYDPVMFPDRVDHAREVQVVDLGDVTESRVTLAEGVACSIQEPTQAARAGVEDQAPGSKGTASVYYRTNPGLATGDLILGTGDHAGRVLVVVMSRPQRSIDLVRWRLDCEERR